MKNLVLGALLAAAVSSAACGGTTADTSAQITAHWSFNTFANRGGPPNNICPSGFLPAPRGNVRTESVADVYRHDELFRRLRDTNALTGKCGRCRFREICGGSRARAFASTGAFNGDALHVFLQRGGDDLLHRPVVTEVDHFGARGLQDAPHDVDRRVVAVEQARRGDEADLVLGLVDQLARVGKVGHVRGSGSNSPD